MTRGRNYEHTSRLCHTYPINLLVEGHSVDSLAEIVSKHQGRRLDKWSHYLGIYEKYLSCYRGCAVTILEIGVNHGGSIDMWREYLGSRCQYIGVDINPECKNFETKNVQIFIGDQSDSKFLSRLADSVGNIDILIDDGGHSMIQQWTTFEVLYPRVAVPGIYICEDTHTSYFPEFGGGRNSPVSFMSRIQRKVDSLNAWHYESHNAVDDFVRTTESMHFYDSVVVIQKKLIESPTVIAKGDIELPAPHQVRGEGFLRNSKRLIGFIRNRPSLYKFLLSVRQRLRNRK